MKIQLTCFSCQKVTEFGERVGLRDECSHCGADAHVCKNCQHYDPKVYNECKETSAERVREKERSNYCDYFAAGGSAASAASQKQDLLSAAEALFKKKP